MDRLKTSDGVEYTSDDYCHDNRCSNRGYHSGIWGGAVGGFVGGGILGYLLGRGGNPWGGPGWNNPGWGFPAGVAHGCVPGVCSESQFVNRFEMTQAERAEKLQAELAQEKAERYADSIGISTFERVVQYFDKQIERRDNLLGEVTRKVADLTTAEAVNNEKLTYLRDKVRTAFADIANLEENTKAAIAASKASIEEWADCTFIKQPKLKLCCSTPTWTCDGSSN